MFEAHGRVCRLRRSARVPVCEQRACRPSPARSAGGARDRSAAVRHTSAPTRRTSALAPWLAAAAYRGASLGIYTTQLRQTVRTRLQLRDALVRVVPANSASPSHCGRRRPPKRRWRSSPRPMFAGSSFEQPVAPRRRAAFSGRSRIVLHRQSPSPARPLSAVVRDGPGSVGAGLEAGGRLTLLNTPADLLSPRPSRSLEPAAARRRRKVPHRPLN